MIEVYEIIGEEHIVARVEEVVTGLSQYLSRKEVDYYGLQLPSQQSAYLPHKVLGRIL